MPAVAVGAVSMFSGYTAFSAVAGWTMANVAAGAMIVGGAMSAFGGATGNDKLAQQGMMLASVGSLGVATLGAPAAAATPATATAAEGTAASAEAQAMNTAYTGGAAAPTGASSVQGGMSQIDMMNAYTEKSNALMQQASKQNMIGSSIGGLAQGAGAYLQSKTQEDIANRDRAEREATAERRRANINNLTGLSLPAVNMPRQPTVPALPGLINAASVQPAQPTIPKPTVTMPGIIGRQGA